MMNSTRSSSPSEYDTALDRVLHVYIGIHGPLGFEVANRCEAIHEGRLGGHGGADRPERDRLFEKLLVIVGPGDMTLEQDVGVAVNQPRQDKWPWTGR